MKQVNISEAKAQLSRHIAYVKAGGRIRIVDRDTPVADLVPVELAPHGRRGDEDEALLVSLERRGLGRRVTRDPLPKDLLRVGPGKRARLSEAVLQERRSSW